MPRPPLFPSIALSRTFLAPARAPRLPLRGLATNAPTPPEHAGKLTLTDKAAKRISVLNEVDGTPDRALRVVIEPGGCHGFQYRLELDNQVNEDDVVYANGPGRIIIDSTSLDLVSGSTVDFVEELIGSKFALKNIPKAESGCGCGTSFNIKI